MNSLDEFIKFFIKIAKLKKIPRKGWVLIEAKNPETIGEHTFQVALMAWLLAKEKKINFNICRILKITLIHDLCELYAGDATPYDKILPKDKKKWPELFDRWPRFSKSEKIKNYLKKHKKERESLMKLTSDLPPVLQKSILNLWLDYEQGITKEGRFVRQVDRLGTLFQALEYGKESKDRPYKSWWIGTKERVDDPFLVKFIEALDKRYRAKRKKKKRRK